jgi:hypothetical protein
MAQIRSPGYPSIPLDQAIDIARKIFEHNRQNAIDREAAAKDLGYAGMTGSSAKTLADLIHFGLIERAGKGGVRVTDTAVRIMHPKNQEEKRSALLSAAYSPDLFNMIREQWPDGFVSENSLRSYLMREGFSSFAIAPVLKSYQKTYAFLQQEDATESHSEPAQSERESVAEEQSSPPGRSSVGRVVSIAGAPATGALGEVIASSPRREGVSLVDGERIVFVEETNPTQYLKLVANGEMDESLLEALEDYVRRQKKRLRISAPTTASASPKSEQDGPTS